MARVSSAQQSGLEGEAGARRGGVEDLATLTHLDETAMLANLRRRYQLDFIYTYVGDILVAVNPFKKIDIYGREAAKQYCGSVCSGKKPSPHIYAVAEAAYCAMNHTSKSQCCVISGESGAGKTESTKFLISHLISLCPQKSASGLEQKIIQVNPLLEAFGNAKTAMNNNSSRFGKYIQVKFRGKQVVGAKISEYLLEKSRVAVQGDGEENFHVFYYMLAGLPQTDLDALRLTSAKECHYLKGSCDTVQASHGKLKEEFDDLINAMDLVGFSSEDQRDMFQALSAVLHIGNVVIGEDGGGRSTLSNPEVLSSIAATLGIHVSHLGGYFTSRETLTAGEIITTHLTKQHAQDGRDAMAKALYGRMFSWIIVRVNSLLAPTEQLQPSEFSEIGVLDIFGFEHFERNSFEQLCINLANEQIQFFFNQHIFLWEQQEYTKEGVDWKEIPFVDNRPLLEMFLEKSVGVLALLDEQSIFPRATDKTYVQKLDEKFRSHAHFVSGRDPNTPQFSIAHYAGKVHYQASGFLEKNRDSMPTGAVELFQASSNDLIHDIFMGSVTRTGTLALKSRKRKSGKTTSRRRKREEDFGRSRTATGRRGLTVGAQFKNSLKLLMEKMAVCTPHFVRCIKPNTRKKAGDFQDDFVLSQLRYTGMLETTRIRREGYAIRPSFEEFVSRFKSLAHLKVRANETGCCKILSAAGITGYHMGKTKVFLKYYHLDVLGRELEKVNRAAMVLQKVLRGNASRKSTFKLQQTAKQEHDVIVKFLSQMQSTGSRVSHQVASHCRQDAARTSENLRKNQGDLLPAFELPPPPSIDELHANLMASATVSSDSSSGEEEEIDGFDVDEVDPMPEQWKQKYKHFGKEGTKAASLRWFRETQAPSAAVKEADGKVCKWFHGIISRREAETLLTSKPQGCFLIRVSETRFGYSLSFRSLNRCKHFMIDQTPSGKYLIVSETRAHPSLQAMVSFHQRVPVCNVPQDLLTIPCGQDGHRSDYRDLLDHSASSSRNQSPAPPPLKPKSVGASSRNQSPAPPPLKPKSVGAMRDLPAPPMEGRRAGPVPPPVSRKSRPRSGTSADDLNPMIRQGQEQYRHDQGLDSHLSSSPPGVVQYRRDSWKTMKQKEQQQQQRQQQQQQPHGSSNNRRSREMSREFRSPSELWAAPHAPAAADAGSGTGARRRHQSDLPPRPMSLVQADNPVQTRGTRSTSHEFVPAHPQSHSHHFPNAGVSSIRSQSEDLQLGSRLSRGNALADQVQDAPPTYPAPTLTKQKRHPQEMSRGADRTSRTSLEDVPSSAAPPPVPRKSRPSASDGDGYSKIDVLDLGLPAPPPDVLVSPVAVSDDFDDSDDDDLALAAPKLILDGGGGDEAGRSGTWDRKRKADFGDGDGYDDLEEVALTAVPTRVLHIPKEDSEYHDIDDSEYHDIDDSEYHDIDDVAMPTQVFHVPKRDSDYDDIDDVAMPTQVFHVPKRDSDYDDIDDVAMPIVVQHKAQAQPGPASSRNRRQKFGSSRRHSQGNLSGSTSGSSLPGLSPSSSRTTISEEPSSSAMPAPPRSSRPLHQLRQDRRPVSMDVSMGGHSPSSHNHPPPPPSHGRTPPPPVDDIYRKNVHIPGAPGPKIPNSDRPVSMMSQGILDRGGRPHNDGLLSPVKSPPALPLKKILNGPRRAPANEMLAESVTRPRSMTSIEPPAAGVSRPVFPRPGKSKASTATIEESPYLLPTDELARTRAASAAAPPLPGETLDYGDEHLARCKVSSSVPVKFGDATFLDEDMFAEGTEDFIDDYCEPADDMLEPHRKFPEVGSMPIPEDDELHTSYYQAPDDDWAGRDGSVRSGNSVRALADAPPVPDRNYSKRDVDKSLDADVHRYTLRLQEEQMQLKMMTWRLADTSLGEDEYAALVNREQHCRRRIINIEHTLASMQVSKNVHSSARTVDGIANTSPPAARRPERRSSALRSGSTVQKKIEAQKQKRRAA